MHKVATTNAVNAASRAGLSTEQVKKLRGLVLKQRTTFCGAVTDKPTANTQVTRVAGDGTGIDDGGGGRARWSVACPWQWAAREDRRVRPVGGRRGKRCARK